MDEKKQYVLKVRIPEIFAYEPFDKILVKHIEEHFKLLSPVKNFKIYMSDVYGMPALKESWINLHFENERDMVTFIMFADNKVIKYAKKANSKKLDKKSK